MKSLNSESRSQNSEGEPIAIKINRFILDSWHYNRTKFVKMLEINSQIIKSVRTYEKTEASTIKFRKEKKVWTKS